MRITARRYQLSRHPVGLPVEGDFEIVELELPAPAAGELLVENLCFSVDPYHREAMEAGGPWQLHQPMEGRTIGRVLAAGIDTVSAGDLVFHRQAYTTHALVRDYRALTVAEGVPLTAYLGILGGTGLTAWVGLTTIGGLRAGESVFITAAGGAVGTAAGHIARALRADRIIGATGSDAKAALLLDGPFDEVFNYRSTDLFQALAGKEVELSLEGVGGDQLGAAIQAAKDPGGRIAWVGAVAQYNDLANPPAAPRNLFDIVGKQLRLEGYLVKDHMDQREPYEQFMIPLIQSGVVPVEETVTAGFDNAVAALRGVLTGENFGKQLVDLRTDSSASDGVAAGPG